VGSSWQDLLISLPGSGEKQCPFQGSFVNLNCVIARERLLSGKVAGTDQIQREIVGLVHDEIKPDTGNAAQDQMQFKRVIRFIQKEWRSVKGRPRNTILSARSSADFTS
jgi:hypothetical protein